MEEEKVSFQAKLITQHKDDRQRVFLLSYYLDSREISIQEGRSPICSNPRSYYSKGKITCPATGKPYETQDFYIGATIQALGRKFYLTDANQASLDLMELHCGRFPKSDLNDAVSALKPAKRNIQQQFQDKDSRGNGFVDVETAQKILDSARILPQYVITVLRRFDDDRGQFDYATLLKYI